MATKKKSAPAKKVAPKKPKPSKPKDSPITLAAIGGITDNIEAAGRAAALAVIGALRKRPGVTPAIAAFLDAASEEVKKGGGQDGGDNAGDPGPGGRTGGGD